MNNKIKKAPTEDPSIKLAVHDASGSRVDVPSEDNNGNSIVWIDPSDSPPSLSFVIRMDPETLKGVADIQYVIETAPFEDLKGGASNPSGSRPPSHSRPSPTPMVPTVPSPRPNTSVSVLESSFVNASTGGGILCNGKRGYARGKKGSVTYELATEKHSRKDSSGASEDDSILSEVVAGYSEYHGPVMLTPRIIFKRKDIQSESPSSTAGPGEL